MQAFACMCLCVYMSVCVYMCVYLCVSLCVCVHVCVHVSVGNQGTHVWFIMASTGSCHCYLPLIHRTVRSLAALTDVIVVVMQVELALSR